jgi:DNA invertase Pin-like site-specific DNA recombinase
MNFTGRDGGRRQWLRGHGGDCRMNVAAYARVSTGTQDLEVQFDEIRQFAERRGWTVVTTDADVASGAREDRVGLRRLLAAAARRKIDAIVVQRFDRAARSVKQLIETLEYLRRCRVHFVSIKEDVDTPTPAGELIFHVMAAIGQFERALIADRIRSGLQRAKALGKPLGRPRTSVSAEQVLALRTQGISYRAIGRRLHISPALAHRLAGALSSLGRPGRSKTSDGGLETAPGASPFEEASRPNPGRLAEGGRRNS